MVLCTKYPAVTMEMVQKDPNQFEAIKKFGAKLHSKNALTFKKNIKNAFAVERRIV